MKKIAILLCVLLIFIPNISFADVPIIHEPTSTKEQCEQWMLDNDVEQEIIDLIPYIYSRCEKIGIDPTIVVGQSALETGYFTSYVFRSNHNTAGIKDRRNANRYAYYETYKDGFNAQMCHLALYTGRPQEKYYYSSRLDGWVTTVEGLTGTWAEDPYYSNKVKSIMQVIQTYEVEEVDEVDETKKEQSEVVNENTANKTNEPLDIITNILSKDEKQSKAAKFLLSFIK